MKTDEHLAYLIAEEAIAKPFRQLQVMSTREMADWLKARDINLDWDFIHRLWRIGIIRPVLVLEPAIEYALSDGTRFRESDDYSGLLPNGRRIARTAERLGFDVSTKSYLDLGRAIDASDFTALQSVESRLPIHHALIWHPLQLWLFNRLFRTINFGAWLGASNVLADTDRLMEIVRWLQQNHLDGLLGFVAEPDVREFDRILALMLAAEPLVHPHIYPTISLRSGSVQEYWDWVSLQAGGELVEQLELTDDTIEVWHRRIAQEAYINDPVGHFRVLLRHANRADLERLKGTPLRSICLYDSAEILRRFSESYRGRALPEEDDVIYGPRSARIKETIYRSSRTSDFDRRVFRRIVRRFGLDPQARTTWYVEGDTEEGFILHVADIEGIDLESAGVTLDVLGGTGEVRTSQFRKELVRLRDQEVFPYLTIDEERSGRHVSTVKRLADDGLLPAGYKVWKRDFEEANFTLEELVEIVNTVLDRELRSEITIDELRERMDRLNVGPAKAIEGMSGISKGIAWGKALATYAVENECPAEIADDRGTRPIFSAYALALTGQRSDYEATTEAVIDDHGNIVHG